MQPSQQDLECHSASSVDPVGPSPPAVDEEATASACASAIDDDVADLGGDGIAALGALGSRSLGSFLAAAADLSATSTTASFRDALTVTSPTLDGEVATVHAAVWVPGVLDLAGAAEGSVRLTLDGPFADADLLLEECSAGAQQCNGAPATFPRLYADTLELAFDVVLGVPMPFGLRLETGASRPAVAVAGSADVDFASTVYWRGILEVAHQGSPVPFAVASESGVDWATPVPEPDRSALLLVALLALGWRCGATPGFGPLPSRARARSVRGSSRDRNG